MVVTIFNMFSGTPELAIISAVLLGIAFSKKLLFHEQKKKVCNTDRSTVGIALQYYGVISLQT